MPYVKPAIKSILLESILEIEQASSDSGIRAILVRRNQPHAQPQQSHPVEKSKTDNSPAEPSCAESSLIGVGSTE